MPSIFRLMLTCIFGLSVSGVSHSQTVTCLNEVFSHTISSDPLGEDREIWVSLPMNYKKGESYPVLYVLDAEWRFDLVRSMAYDLSGNRKIPRHIVVGIPHIDMENKRGIDLTFSQSRIEYDGEAVDSTWYNASNSGGAERFYHFLSDELIPLINKHYATNGNNILVGHSYGGYFGAYIAGRNHPFSALQLYDPSLWYSGGEAMEQALKNTNKEINVFVTYQDEPEYHAGMIRDFIESAGEYFQFGSLSFPEETHNSLFMRSFLEGMSFLYSDYRVGTD